MRTLLLAALAAVALLVAVPGTSGAWTASLRNADAATTSAWFTCGSALGALSGSAFISWPLADAASTTVAQDSVSSARDGAYRGARAVTTSGPGGCVGETGRAALLDGTTSWVTSPSITPTAAESSALTRTATVAAWVRTTPSSRRGGDVLLICLPTTAPACSSRDHRLYVTGDGRVVFGTATTNGRTQSVVSAAAVNDGAWHHLAGTVSSSGMRLFVDGAEVTATATVWFDGSRTSASAAGYTSTRPLPASFTVEVGTGDGATNWPLRPQGAGQTYFDGAVAQTGIWTTALSPYQIASLAAAGR